MIKDHNHYVCISKICIFTTSKSQNFENLRIFFHSFRSCSTYDLPESAVTLADLSGIFSFVCLSTHLSVCLSSVRLPFGFSVFGDLKIQILFSFVRWEDKSKMLNISQIFRKLILGLGQSVETRSPKMKKWKGRNITNNNYGVLKKIALKKQQGWKEHNILRCFVNEKLIEVFIWCVLHCQFILSLIIKFNIWILGNKTT